MKNIIDKIASIKSLDELDASQLADIIQFLIKSELKPGGPYIFNSSRDQVWLNNHIYNLFAAKGKELDSSMITEDVNLTESHITPPPLGSSNPAMYATISKDILSLAAAGIKDKVNNVIIKVEKADKSGEISKLSSVFYNSIKDEFNDKFYLTSNLKDEFSYANTYTWITYSLIDMLLDTNFNPQLLPIVSILQRKIANHYIKAGVDTQLLKTMFDQVDKANALELDFRNQIRVDTAKDNVVFEKVKFSGIEQLMWQKSIAHTIGPIEITTRIENSFNREIKQAMQLYCSARQLNDDLHDWIDDFSNGEITYVVSKLLDATNTTTGEHKFSDLLELMKLAYWDTVLIESCEEIEAKIHQAIDLLENTILKQNAEFNNLFLAPISAAARQAINKHVYDKNFLENISQ